MDRLNVAILAPASDRGAVLARIDALERETNARLLHGVTTAAEYRTINDILAQQHTEALVFATSPPKRS